MCECVRVLFFVIMCIKCVVYIAGIWGFVFNELYSWLIQWLMFILTPRISIDACLTCQTQIEWIVYASCISMQYCMCWTRANGERTVQKQKPIGKYWAYVYLYSNIFTFLWRSNSFLYHFSFVFFRSLSLSDLIQTCINVVSLPICICFKCFHVQFVERIQNIILYLSCYAYAVACFMLFCGCYHAWVSARVSERARV